MLKIDWEQVADECSLAAVDTGVGLVRLPYVRADRRGLSRLARQAADYRLTLADDDGVLTAIAIPCEIGR